MADTKTGMVAYEYREIAEVIDAVTGVADNQDVQIDLVTGTTSRGQAFEVRYVPAPNQRSSGEHVGVLV